MIIKCPLCGPREASEYNYMGDATLKRPEPEIIDIKIWSDYVHQRDNPRGKHQEYWQHTGGCRSILKVTRDTVSHAISKVELEGIWAKEDAS